MADFLWEIGCEEIPARMQKNAQETLHRMVTQHAKGIGFQSIHTYVAPRRLAIILHDVARILEKPEIKQGPLVDLGETALAGFCRTWGIQAQDCTPVSGPKGLVWSATITPKEIPIETCLIDLCTHVLKSMFWPKRMRWNDDFSWIRPIRWLLTLYGDQPLSWSWNDVVAGSWSEAHRLAPHTAFFDSSTDTLYQNTPFSRLGMHIISPETYATQLAHSGVVVDAQARSERIIRDVTALATEYGGVVCRETLEALVQENTGLAQWPKAVACDFDPVFLSLPVEVIATTLQVHQKCFSIRSAKNPDQLLPHFVMIADGPLPVDTIRKGYERVVQARLADALFFWNQDLKSLLLDRLPDLALRSFFQDLGTMYDKTQRVRQIAAMIADQTGVLPQMAQEIDQVVCLSKCDLLTAMVGEFPTLQGVMGRYYAEKQGFSSDVARALQDSYDYHRYDSLYLKNYTAHSAILAISDGMDTLVGFFGVGRVPSGSKDPMALRRACHGVIKAIVSHNIHFDLAACVHTILTAYQSQGFLADVSADLLTQQMTGFFHDRLAYLLKEAGHTTDAKKIKDGALGQHVLEIWRSAQQLTFLAENHGDFLGAYRRVHALVALMQDQSDSQDFTILQHPLERQILDQLNRPLDLKNTPALPKSLQEWTSLLHAFLDGIKIQEAHYTASRLGLLRAIVVHFQPLGPIHLLVG